MTSSGTNAFLPSIGELTLYTFGLIGIRRSELTQQHLADARLAVNIMLAEWDNSTPNLWKVDLVSLPLIEGTKTYSVDASCIMILDAYIRTNDGQTDEQDRIIWPISRSEYAAQPNKDMEGAPTIFWFDRLLAPTITLWLVPDGNGPYLLNYYRVTSIFDANMANGETPDVPVIWLGAFAYGLAARLAESYAPDRVQRLEARAERALALAQAQNIENVNVVIAPTIGSYYSR